MEGWLNLGDESALHDIEILEDSEKKSGFALDIKFSLEECGFDESKNRLRSLFNEVLVIFLREMSVKKCCIRPLPVLCAKGRPVDLFKLFCVVRKIGGYDSVSSKKLWGFVAEECGLHLVEIASVKLIYLKYLNELDHWLQEGFIASGLDDGGYRVVKKLELLLQELESDFRGLPNLGQKAGKKGVKCDKIEIDLGDARRLLDYSSSRNVSELHDCKIRHGNDDDEKIYYANDNDLVRSVKQVIEKVSREVHHFSDGNICAGDKHSCSIDGNGVNPSAKKVLEKAMYKLHGSSEIIANGNGERLCAPIENDVLFSQKNVVDEVLDLRKRKRESSSWSEMHNWLLYVAKHPDDPAIGRIPECSKWKEHGSEKLWFQALLARKALFIKRHVNRNVESYSQQKFRMHPSMYEANALAHQSAEKSRCSQRLPLVKAQLCACCNSAPEHKVCSPHKAEARNCTEEQPILNAEVSASDKMDDISMEEPSEKQVSVGPLFQAEVPEWTGVVTESDSKWLGQRMWPTKDSKDESVVKLNSIGRGSPVTCDCSFPGSTECIRFHIAEKRMKLKLELGSLFYKWRFHHMGEEVSLSWTIEEEKKFKDMIRLNSASTNKFWGNPFKLFPSKTREKLVSYYFNVFLIRRRSYENRVTPKDIDSDDDEKEFGSVGGSFSYKATYVPGSTLPICSENKQCADLE